MVWSNDKENKTLKLLLIYQIFTTLLNNKTGHLYILFESRSFGDQINEMIINCQSYDNCQ